MFVAVEGMDGVGKTALSKRIARECNYTYVERPMQKVLGLTDEQYDALCNYIWSQDNKNVPLCFFMLGNLLTRYYGENIIVDRHILSSYYWDGNNQNQDVFYYFCNGKVIPDLTLILYASPEVRAKRIKGRNPDDIDLNDSIVMAYGYDKMLTFAKDIELPYILVNTETKDNIEVFNYCLKILSDYFDSNNKKEDVLNYYNDLFFKEQDGEMILKLKNNK